MSDTVETFINIFGIIIMFVLLFGVAFYIHVSDYGVKIVGIKEVSNNYCEITTRSIKTRLHDDEHGFPEIVDSKTCDQYKILYEIGHCYDYSYDVNRWLEIDCKTGDWI